MNFTELQEWAVSKGIEVFFSQFPDDKQWRLDTSLPPVSGDRRQPITETYTYSTTAEQSTFFLQFKEKVERILSERG